MSNEVQVTLTLEEREALKSINKLEKSVESFANNTTKAISKTDIAIGAFVGNLASNLVSSGIAKIGSSIKNFFNGAITASLEAESALNRLSVALKTSGSFSQAALKDFDNFAKVIERTTKFDGDLVLSQLAVAKSFGLTNDQAKQVLSTATGLATALGVSLESATEQLSGTLNGTIGRLGKVVPELKALSEEQLRAGEGLRILSDRFKGVAEGDAKTFQGQLTISKAAVGELQEELGNLITQSPEVRLSLKQITETILGLTNGVKSLAPLVDSTFGALRIAFGGISEDALPKAREQITKIDEEINKLKATLSAQQEGEKTLLDRIFGSDGGEAIETKIQELVNQKQVLENQILEVERNSNQIRSEQQQKFIEDSLTRSKRLYLEQMALDKQITAQKDKEAKVQRDIQNSLLTSTSQFIGATAALFKNNSREQKVISIATATIDTYVAANKALASGSALSPAAGFAAAAAAIATGLANVAKITSVGSFQNGGFIGGNSYSGDRLTANVNSGEAVLNSRQQRNFMELANNGVAGNNASIDLLDEIRNLRSAIMAQPVVVAVSGREIARVVRDERAAGFAI